MTEPLVARRSVTHWLWALLAGVAGVIVTSRGGATWESAAFIWIAVVVAPPALMLLHAALDRDEVLRIDDAGVHDRRLHVGTVPWPRIAGVARAGGKLRLDLMDAELMEREHAQRPFYSRPLQRRAEPALFIATSGLDVDAGRLEEAMRAHLALWR